MDLPLIQRWILDGNLRRLREMLGTAVPGLYSAVAIRTLGLAGDRSAIPAIVPFLEESFEPRLREVAALALAQLGPDAVTAVLPLLRESRFTLGALWMASAGADSRWPSSILELRGEGSNCALDAAFVSSLRHATYAPVLLEALAMPFTVATRRILLTALGDLGHREVIPQATLALKDTDSVLCRVAIKVLGQVGNPDCVNVLRPFLHHQEGSLRATAAWSLGRLGDRASVATLIGLLESDPLPEVREVAARTLGSLGDPSAVPALLDAVEHVYAAPMALAEFESQVLDSLPWQEAGTWSDGRRCQIGTALGLFDAPAAGAFLRSWLGDPNAAVRAAVAEAMGNRGESVDREPLMKRLLEEPNSFVRGQIARSLGKIGGERVLPLLVGFVASEPDATARLIGMQGLAELRDPMALSALRSCYGADPDVGVRELAASLLAQYPEPDLLRFLLRVHQFEQNDAVRGALEDSVLEISGTLAVRMPAPS